MRFVNMGHLIVIVVSGTMAIKSDDSCAEFIKNNNKNGTISEIEFIERQHHKFMKEYNKKRRKRSMKFSCKKETKINVCVHFLNCNYKIVWLM